MGTLTTYDDLLAHAQALIATTDRIPVIGISGHGGSGKSTPRSPSVTPVLGNV